MISLDTIYFTKLLNELVIQLEIFSYKLRINKTTDWDNILFC